jgi:copper chaperone CopZ
MDSNCYVEPIQKEATQEERQNLETVGLAVWGMGCPNCAARVRNSLLALTGVVEADVDQRTGYAFVEYSPSLVSVASMLEVITQAGNDGHHRYVAMLLKEATL